ncbi:hypothetical protein P3T76_014512 [Phytophthora citrophthora]|uniref:Uncharacterized protein n=1 Tax=Phytophthora citrophthora TaxID=4793 RepID=A0AAD9G1C0_9STRA|nr:hypothetical protein P3T76_014512 [Phytophthora citrophthora]
MTMHFLQEQRQSGDTADELKVSRRAQLVLKLHLYLTHGLLLEGLELLENLLLNNTQTKTARTTHRRSPGLNFSSFFCQSENILIESK